MAFDFLGTFTRDEILGLLDWVDTRTTEFHGRISHLRREVERLGWIRYSTDNDGNVTGFDVLPKDSLLAKYVRTYLFLGGDPVDLDILSRGNWIHLTKGEWELDSREFQGGNPSHGKYDPPRAYDDAMSSVAVYKVKETVEAALKRREGVEFRIKRTVDLLDQYVEEVILLAKRTEGVETIDDLRGRLEFLLDTEDYAAAGKKPLNQ